MNARKFSYFILSFGEKTWTEYKKNEFILKRIRSRRKETSEIFGKKKLLVNLMTYKIYKGNG